MNRLRSLIVLAALQASVPSVTTAEPKGTAEIGLDGGVTSLTVGDGGSTFVTIEFPVRDLRVGCFISERFQIEPSLGYNLVSREYDGADSSGLFGVPPSETDYALEMGLALAFHGQQSGLRPFAKVGAVVELISVDGTDTQFGIEGDVGLKTRGEGRWGARLALGVAKLFETDSLRGAWAVALRIGFSYFTR